MSERSTATTTTTTTGTTTTTTTTPAATTTTTTASYQVDDKEEKLRKTIGDSKWLKCFKVASLFIFNRIRSGAKTSHQRGHLPCRHLPCRINDCSIGYCRWFILKFLFVKNLFECCKCDHAQIVELVWQSLCPFSRFPVNQLWCQHIGFEPLINGVR